MLPSPSQRAVTAATAASGVSGAGVTRATRPSKRSGVRRREAGALGARHGVSADEAQHLPALDTRQPPRPRLRLTLPASVKTAPGREMRPGRADEPRQRAHGGTEHHQRPRPPRRPPGRWCLLSAAPASRVARTAASCRATTTTSPASLRARTPLAIEPPMVAPGLNDGQAARPGEVCPLICKGLISK